MAFGVRKGMVYNLLGMGLSGVFIFIFNILAGRILGPSKFGIVSVFYSLLLTLQALLAGGFRDTTVKLVSEYDGAERGGYIGYLVSGILEIFVILYLIFIILILINRNHLEINLFGKSTGNLFLFVISVFLFSLFWILNSVFEGLRRFDISNLCLSIFYFFFPTLFLINYYLRFKQPFGTLLAIMFSPLFALILLLVIFKSYNLNITLRNKFSQNVPFVKIAALLTFINFFDIFIFRSPPILVKLAGGETFLYAGFIGAFLGLLNIVRTISIALFRSLFPNLNRAFVERNRILAINYIRHSTLFMLILGITVLLVFGLKGPAILKFIYGEKYLMTSPQTLVFSLFLVFYLIARLFNRILISTGNMVWILLTLLIAFTLLIFTFLIIHTEPLIRVGLSITCGAFIYLILSGFKVYLIQKSL